MNYSHRFLALMVVLFLPSESITAAQPNILFLLSDDQRPDTIAALGNPQIETPQLDKLVRRGTTFTRAHATNPICFASRAQILTGCNSFTNGCLLKNRLDESLPLWPELMQQAGYQTFYIGKWHTLGRPSQRGYSQSLGLFASGGGKLWKDQVDFKGTPITGYRGWVFQTDRGKIFPDLGVGLTADTNVQIADAAIKAIEQSSGQPFFLHVNFTAPHDPLIMPIGYEKRYAAADIPLPKNFLPKHPFDHGNFAGRDEQMLAWPRSQQAVRENLAMYYRVITHLDHQVGRIIEALEANEKANNTIVIYSSDHGLAVGSHGLMGKQNMYDHTILVPLILAGPNIPAGRQSDALVYLRDLFPTCCQLTNIDIPQSVDSRSLVPIFQSKQSRIRDRAFCYFGNVQRMVRNNQFKLIHYPEIDRYQFFNTQQDTHELQDLIASKLHVQQIAELKAELAKLQTQTGDPLVADKK